jgi:hypothetical protein
MFRPESLPGSVQVGVALTPPVVAGLILFRLQAVEMLTIALAVGGIMQVAARLARVRLDRSPVLPALIGVALVGPGAASLWTVGVAVLASGLDLARTHYLPRLRFEAGILAYCFFFLAARGQLGSYLNPSNQRELAEPIAYWLNFFRTSDAPIDAVRLYVGNVAGPVFATSLLAVGLSLAWLWYARRLSLTVVVGFLIGAMLPVLVMRWNAVYQLDSGPTWFGVGLALADVRNLPQSRKVRFLIGLAAGVIALSLRTRQIGVEGVFLAVALIQVSVALVEGLAAVIAARARIAHQVGRFLRGGVRLLRRAS